jgi:hypothetical protein
MLVTLSGITIDANPECLNASVPMLVTPFSISIDSRFLQPSNIDSGMLVMLLPNVTEVSSEFAENAPLPILVTLSGTDTAVSLVFLNAHMPMFVTLSGIDTAVSLVFANASLPMLITLSGIDTAVSPVFLNVPSSMLVKLSGIVTDTRLRCPESAFSAIETVPAFRTTEVFSGISLLQPYTTLPAYTMPSS